jgi:hypothetical protein
MTSLPLYVPILSHKAANRWNTTKVVCTLQTARVGESQHKYQFTVLLRTTEVSCSKEYTDLVEQLSALNGSGAMSDVAPYIPGVLH